MNSESIIQCTEERMQKLDKRIAAFTRRTEEIDIVYRQEEDEFQVLLLSLANFSKSVL